MYSWFSLSNTRLPFVMTQPFWDLFSLTDTLLFLWFFFPYSLQSKHLAHLIFVQNFRFFFLEMMEIQVHARMRSFWVDIILCLSILLQFFTHNGELTWSSFLLLKWFLRKGSRKVDVYIVNFGKKVLLKFIKLFLSEISRLKTLIISLRMLFPVLSMTMKLTESILPLRSSRFIGRMTITIVYIVINLQTRIMLTL